MAHCSANYAPAACTQTSSQCFVGLMVSCCAAAASTKAGCVTCSSTMALRTALVSGGSMARDRKSTGSACDHGNAQHLQFWDIKNMARQGCNA